MELSILNRKIQIFLGKEGMQSSPENHKYS